MDWFTWLSKTDLNPALVYQYAITFSHNELGQDDIPYFSHEFLQSMGVKVAKHRLEILKLARKERGIGRNIRLMLWLALAIKQTRKYFTRRVQALVHRENSALSVVPARSHSLRWKVGKLQRNKRLRTAPSSEWGMSRNDSPAFLSCRETLLLTEGRTGGSRNSDSTQSLEWIETEGSVEPAFGTKDAFGNPWNSSFSSTLVHSLDRGYWSSSTDEIKWDSMFQNLKPT